MTGNLINFTNIKMHNGSQNTGFEEFCCQLFPLMIQTKIIKIERINGAGGDGGIEVKYYLEDGRVIGLQAKYFSRLGQSQWSQIDKSVTTMLSKHPDIVEYYVCTPINRTPAQIKTWETNVETWKSKATCSSIVFAWIGESELLDCLIYPRANHIKSYWFDCPNFDIEWVAKQTRISIDQLHHRYTPKLHQKTRSEQMLSLVMGSGKIIDEYKKLCSDVFLGWEKISQFTARKINEKNAFSLVEKLEYFQNLVKSLYTELYEGDIALQSNRLIDVLNDLEGNIKQLIYEL